MHCIIHKRQGSQKTSAHQSGQFTWHRLAVFRVKFQHNAFVLKDFGAKLPGARFFCYYFKHIWKIFPEVMLPSLIRHMGDQYSSAMCAFILWKLQATKWCFKCVECSGTRILKINKTIHLGFEDWLHGTIHWQLRKEACWMKEDAPKSWSHRSPDTRD